MYKGFCSYYIHAFFVADRGSLCNRWKQFFRGTISIVSADNPASASLGGLKQSASAFRYCRHCLGSEDDIQSKVTPPVLHAHVHIQNMYSAYKQTTYVHTVYKRSNTTANICLYV